METFKFEAEINQLMHLIINAFYSNKDVFLRELISNASDALDKVKYLSFTENKEILKDDSDLSIKIIPDKTSNTLTIQDSGIGMTKDELIQNLGTIAKSGTKAFLDNFKNNKDLNMIGQFGVGFYSAYLVSSSVVVTSKSPNCDKTFRWESCANGNYSISECESSDSLKRGTSITLHLRDSEKEYLEATKLKDIIHQHSNYISYPILLWTEKTKESDKPETDVEEPEDDLEETNKDDLEEPNKVQVEELNKVQVEEPNKDDLEEPNKEPVEEPTKEVTSEDKQRNNNEVTVEDDIENENELEKEVEPKPEKYFEFDQVNKQEPLWTKNPSQVTEDEYKEFYKNFANDHEEFLLLSHFRTEGSMEFTSLLFVPKRAPFDMFQSKEHGKGVKLFVKRVFITDKCEEMIPEYLSFLRGMVDSNDLPLNVSREMLQHNTVLKKMRKHLVKKVIDMLVKCSEEDKEKFKIFYSQYSKNIKLGVYEDNENREKLMKLLRFFSVNHKDNEITLNEYVTEMKEGQKDIYYITGESLSIMEDSPFLQALKKRNYDVLFLIDPIDEYAIGQMKEFEGKKLVDITKEGLNLEDEQKKEEPSHEKYSELCKHMKNILGDKVEKIIVSNRSIDTACVLTTGQYGWSANMERIMKAQALRNNEMSMFMKSRKTMELNPDHKLIELLRKKFEENKEDKTVKDLVWMIYETSLLTSGFNVDHPNTYAKRIYNMVTYGLSGEQSDEIIEDKETEETQLDMPTSEVEESVLPNGCACGPACESKCNNDCKCSGENAQMMENLD